MITNNTTYKLKAGQGSKSSPSAAVAAAAAAPSDADEDVVDDGHDADTNHKYLYVPGVPKLRIAKQQQQPPATAANFYLGKSSGSSRNDRSERNDRGDRRNNYNRRGAGKDYLRDARAAKERDRDRDRDYGYDAVCLFQYAKYANAGDAEKKAEKEIKFNLPEDTRISKLLRRLSNEEDPENSLQISKKLLEVLMLPENATYVRKSFAILRDSMLQILQVAPGPAAKTQCARAFGRIGYIMAGDAFDFAKYVRVIKKFNSHATQNGKEEMFCLFMEALRETLEIEKKHPIIDKSKMSLLMVELNASIENTENAEVFKLILDNLMMSIEFYPANFNKYFKDTIDVLFGWHVDHTQPLSNIKFISGQVQRVSGHFHDNLDISITLLLHFVEDIETYSAQMSVTHEDFDVESVDHVTLYILALNTVLKCLQGSTLVLSHAMFTKKTIADAMKQVQHTIKQSVALKICDNLLIAANESISLLLGFYNTIQCEAPSIDPSIEAFETKTPAKSSENTLSVVQDIVFTLVDLELQLVHSFSNSTKISMLVLISKVIKELSADLNIDLIPKLVGPASTLLSLRFSPYMDIQEGLISVYQTLLNLKNIPLLQEVYKFLLGDLQMSYELFIDGDFNVIENNPFAGSACEGPARAQFNCLFLLRCLSQLANDSGSIVGMWILKPSVLELLGVAMQPYNPRVAQFPALQMCILNLLHSHCKSYNYFISKSPLISPPTEFGGWSPTSNNFSIILGVLHTTCKKSDNNEVKLLLLQCFEEVLTLGESYMKALCNSAEFMAMTDVLLANANCMDQKVMLRVAQNLEKLLADRQLPWKNDFLLEVNKLCNLHMTSTNEALRKCYTKLSGWIPWDVTIMDSENCGAVTEDLGVSLGDYSLKSVQLAKRLHINGSVFGEMPAHNFKQLMNYLLKNEPATENFLINMLANCWPLESDAGVLSEQYRDLAMNSRQVLYSWATWEAAQLCVNSKLRTPLGKPNETFTSFDNALKQLARDVMKIKHGTEGGRSRVSDTRVRLLLQFIEHLEMAIYNASEGTALAIPPPQKPVRTFFCTNAGTCREWLSRLRIMLVQLALHAGLDVIAVRHGQQLIVDLQKSGKVETVEFERAIVYLTMAFINLQESEAITGLYVWCKGQSRKFDWVKCAAEQANKKYEAAAAGYQRIIDVSNVSELDIYVRNFINDQIIACYKHLNSWLDIVQYKSGKMSVLMSEGENGMRYTFNTVNFDCAQSIFNLETSTHALEELSTWKELDQARDSWSSYDCLLTTESDLYQVALNVEASDQQVLKTSLDSEMVKIRNAMQENALFGPVQFHQDFTLMHYVSAGLQNAVQMMYQAPLASTAFLVSENFEMKVGKIDCAILGKILWWTDYFCTMQSQHLPTFSNNLRLNIIKKSRKERNVSLATSQLFRFLNSNNLLAIEDRGTAQNLLVNVAESFKSKIPEITMWDLDGAKAVQEITKLLYEEAADGCNPKKLAFDICAIASTSLYKCADMYANPELNQVSSRILLKLGGWLQNNEISVGELDAPFGKLLMVLPEIGIENIGNNIIPMNEMVIGKLLQFSINQCQTLAKGWHAFGTWCYRWGRKIVDNSADLSNTLTLEDKALIQGLLPGQKEGLDFERILSILSQTRAYVDEEDIDSNEIHTSDMIRNQLKNVSSLFNASEELIEQLVAVWRNLQRRVYAYYEHSVEAYFKYLHLATQDENISKATESNTVTVTLRLLRLVVKHALELQSVLEKGLTTTPTHPWKIIIPQLFSRLNHPESYVRERVSELLCRVAEDAPHLITFPAVVGALEGGVNFDFSEISLPKDCLSQDNDPSEDAELNDIEEDAYESDEESKNVLQDCFKSMVETLSKQAPETITQVQTLVKELRRIILLWDELWLGTLAQHHSEINKRQQQMEFEIEKVNQNSYLFPEQKVALITEKHRIIIKPIIFILEQLYDITSVEPETPHEKHFQEKYLPLIKTVLHKLKNPDNPDEPQESWRLLKELQNQFQQKAHKRSVLKMENISPILAKIRDTVISMPGQDKPRFMSTKVYISHVSNQVSILPTKTKPKKLIFHGSDGHSYTYLFKGLEDLHLDERIMQFLSIANTMMAQNTEGTGHNLYRARHYSVIPLGPRSGLISWVGGTTPVFALYKRWQQREASKASKNTSAVSRPSELFYSKLNPLLQEHGVKNIDNRKEWPLVALKQVLTELMAETPSNLLAKELWCHAVSPGAWWQIVRKYSYSVAVMSIIGYIIGLGDRHLDNVLVDLNTGEVVHIDYNVCFEKGKTLRVPEKVPFRLTPNIRDALGVTGVEGMFRLACENILKTMKKGRETLLTLLEAFVYDPLVDWTVGNDGLVGTTFGGMSTCASHRQTRKDLEKEVTLAMYRVRCNEVKSEWNFNKSDITKLIPELYAVLDTWCELYDQSTSSDDMLQDLHQQMALVKEAEANGPSKHNLQTLPMRYDALKKTRDTFEQARADLEKLEQECTAHIQLYKEAVKALQTQQVQQWYMELNAPAGNKVQIFDIVKEFLLNAGQTNMITQCEQIEAEVLATYEQQQLLTHKCLNLLQEYGVVFAQCPPSFIEEHRIYYYLNWAKMLLVSDDEDKCEPIYQQFYAFLNLATKPINAIITYNIKLNQLLSNTAAKMAKAYEDLNNVRTEEPRVLEKFYTEAKLCLANFVKREPQAPKALEFVIFSELLSLNRTFLTLETAASKTGDWLIKLTSRDGDWFLDDLTLCCSKAIELISYLQLDQTINDDHFTHVVDGLQAANNLYKSLHELHFNFHTIILPESIKKLQSEEVSVMSIIHELNAIVMSVGPLQELVQQLEKNLHCVVMEMDYTGNDVFEEQMIALKNQYQRLLQASSNMLTPGRMLLMGFNGLFDKLHLECNNVVNLLGNVNVPSSWRKLDQVREAKSLAAPIFNARVHAILDDIFLLKRLQTMCEFFALCLEVCQSFKGLGENIVMVDDEQLLKPIRKFIADFISRQFLGITTEAIAYAQCYLLQSLGLDVTNEIEQKDIGAEHKVPLDELYQKGWNIFLKNGTFSQNVLAQASSVESNLKNAWEKIQEPKKLEKSVTLLQSSLTRLQNQLTVHAWLHEEALQQSNKCSYMRSKFLVEMRNKSAALSRVQSKANEVRDKQKTLIASISQRLKWAAGANPDLAETIVQFELAVGQREERLGMEQHISNMTLTTSTNILRYELLRCSTTESKACDQIFMHGYEQWTSACRFSTVKIDAVSHVEENIMKFYNADMEDDPKWILAVSDKISEAITSAQTTSIDVKVKLFAAAASINLKQDELKTLYNKHCNVMNDFKGLIKAMLKIEESAVKTQQFVYEYRQYVENFAGVFHHMKKEYTVEEVNALRRKLQSLEKLTEAMHRELLELEENEECIVAAGALLGRKQLVRQEGVSLSPVRAMPNKQESMTKGQQRNAYAVGVWRRVRMKLEGKDPDPGRKYSTQEQVDYVIREATSIDNLALLYEGWTPWV